MQKAFDSCDNQYIDELASMFDSFPLSFSDGDVVEVNGEWKVALSVPAKLLEKYQYILSDEEMSDFELCIKLIELATQQALCSCVKNLILYDMEEQFVKRFV